MAKAARKKKDEKMPGRNRPQSKRPKLAQRQLQRRDKLWPDADAVVWNRKNEQGWVTIPRLLPLIMALIKTELSKGGGDPTSVYLDLWARQFDNMMVEVTNDEDFAYSSGYTGNRAVRTWKERIRCLEDLGFIRIKEKGMRKIGYILIVNPLQVVSGLREKHPERVPDNWWIAFVDYADKIGAQLP